MRPRAPTGLVARGFPFALDRENGEYGGGVEAAAVGVFDERPGDLARRLRRHAATPERLFDRRNVLASRASTYPAVRSPAACARSRTCGSALRVGYAGTSRPLAMRTGVSSGSVRARWVSFPMPTPAASRNGTRTGKPSPRLEEPLQLGDHVDRGGGLHSAASPAQSEHRPSVHLSVDRRAAHLRRTAAFTPLGTTAADAQKRPISRCDLAAAISASTSSLVKRYSVLQNSQTNSLWPFSASLSRSASSSAAPRRIRARSARSRVQGQWNRTPFRARTSYP